MLGDTFTGNRQDEGGQNSSPKDNAENVGEKTKIKPWHMAKPILQAKNNQSQNKMQNSRKIIKVKTCTLQDEAKER